jgi:type II secretory pathway pseudopilin PulG
MGDPSLNRKRRFYEQGLSLIEVLIAVFFITPILIFLLKVFLQNVRGVTESWDESKAISSAQRLMDQIRSKKWDNLTVFGSTIATINASIGSDGFDDIDDWDSVLLPPDPLFPEYTRSVTVAFVNVDVAGNVTDSGGVKTDFKRVTVRVTNRGGRPFVLSVIFTNSFP